jgi:hypothetical protein
MADERFNVIFHDIIVENDGQPIGPGRIYYSLEVDGVVVASRPSSNPIKIGSGGKIYLGQSRTVTKSGAPGTKIVINGMVGEKDDGPFSGRDESSTDVRSYGPEVGYGSFGPNSLNFQDNKLSARVNFSIERV